jgi:[ribosomal protein S5]-alanine N-acetyltransferase
MPTTGAEGARPTAGLAAVLPVETARLRLRLLAPADAPAIKRLAGEWEVTRFTVSIPHPYPNGSAAPWIEET